MFMAPAQSKASKDAIKDRKQQLRAEFARGNAMRKHAKETGKEYDLSTPLLDDGTCTITLGSLMESENLKYEEAVEVMKRFRAEAEHEGWELPKLPKAKPSKASNKTASEGSVVAASDATKSEDAEPASKSAPKKRKAEDAGHDDNTASNKNPPEKAEPKAKAKAKAKGKAKAAAPPMDDAPEPEECPELAPAKTKKTKQPAKEPSAASSAKPTTNSKKRAKQEAAEADPTSEPTPEPTPDPTPEPVTRSKKVKKVKKVNKARSSKLRKLRAKEDLGEEAEEEQHEEEEEETAPTEKSANIKAEVEAMIREIDEQMNMPKEKEKASPAPARPVVNHRRMSKGPPTEPPTSPTPKAKSQAWTHDRQPENADEAALHGGWCLAGHKVCL